MKANSYTKAGYTAYPYTHTYVALKVESSFGTAEANGWHIKSKEAIEYERACAQMNKAIRFPSHHIGKQVNVFIANENSKPLNAN